MSKFFPKPAASSMAIKRIASTNLFLDFLFNKDNFPIHNKEIAAYVWLVLPSLLLPLLFLIPSVNSMETSNFVSEYHPA